MLEFRVEWYPAERMRIREHAVTYCRLEVRLEGRVVTFCQREAEPGPREAVHVPAYVLAEWIAHHWWALLWQPRGRQPPSPVRVRSGLEGFAVPDMEFEGLEDAVRVHVRRSDGPWGGVRFLVGHLAVVPRVELEASLAAFIETVVRRLRDSGVTGTALQQEWAALTELTEGERQFARACGLAGLDVFAVAGSDAEAIERAWQTLTSAGAGHLVDEVLAVAEPASVDHAARRVVAWLEAARREPPAVGGWWRAVDARGLPERDRLRPWRWGYACAMELRKRLGLEPGPLAEGVLADLERLWRPADESDRTGVPAGVDAVVVRRDAGGVVLAGGTGSSRPRARFTACRGLFSVLAVPDVEVAVLTRSSRDVQQAGRAFAAELLAPAEALARDAGLLFAEEGVESGVEELARRYGVPMVMIQHQLENHGLWEWEPGVFR